MAVTVIAAAESRGRGEINNNQLLGQGSVLLPHDLYDPTDYSHRATAATSAHSSSAPPLYARVVPRSQRRRAAVCGEAGPSDGDRRLEAALDTGDTGHGGDTVTSDARSRPSAGSPVQGSPSPRVTEPRHEDTGDQRDTDTVHPGSRGQDGRHHHDAAPLLPAASTTLLSSIPGASRHRRPHFNLQKCEIDSQIREKLRRQFALLQRVRRSRLAAARGPDTDTKLGAAKPPPKFQLPPVCGKSPPCSCPEDQLYAAKLRVRILKKISTLRRRHLRLRVTRR